MKNINRVLALTILGSLGAVTGIQKISGDFIPSWFAEKFGSTLIDAFPGSLEVSYSIIIALEISIGILAILALIKTEFLQNSSKRFSNLLFTCCYALFTILFFGSFVAHDYENGFSDFGYFAFTLLIQHFLFKEDQLTPNE